jgi:hypothetical protein
MPKTESAVAALRETDAQTVSSDKLDKVRAEVRKLRDKQREKADLEERLRSVNIDLNDILWSKLPQIMDENMVPSITLAAEGNHEAVTVEIGDYYKAAIPQDTDEDPDASARAYAMLNKKKGGDLVKKQYIVSFSMGTSKAQRAFEALMRKAKTPFETKQGVPWNSLTSWFREEYKKKPWTTQEMETLGAKVGRVATVKKPKEKK